MVGILPLSRHYASEPVLRCGVKRTFLAKKCRFTRSHINEIKVSVRMAEQLSKDNHFVSRVEVSDIYIENGKAWVIDSRDVLDTDDDHLSYFGSLKAKLKISESIKNILSTELD